MFVSLLLLPASISTDPKSELCYGCGLAPWFLLHGYETAEEDEPCDKGGDGDEVESPLPRPRLFAFTTIPEH